MKNNTESMAHGAGDGAEICPECNGKMYTVETVGDGHEKRVGCRGCAGTGRVAKRKTPNRDGLAVECPACRGYGVTSAALLEFSDGKTAVAVSKCQPCGGHGNVNRNVAERIERGKQFRRRRLECALTLRAAAALLHVTAQQLTRAELGLDANDWLDKANSDWLALHYQNPIPPAPEPSRNQPRTFQDSPTLFGD